MNKVKEYYNQSVDKEWNRLNRDDYHLIEFEITKKFILKYLKPQSRVADIGGGPGKYTLWLLQNGHSVLLSDLSSNLLERANDEVSKLKLHTNFKGAYERNAMNLQGIPDNEHEVTLLFGPLYHLLEVEEREIALKEAVRITKPGGFIFVATINRLCPVRDMMFGSTEYCVKELEENYEKILQIVDNGKYRNTSGDSSAFTDAYFAEVDEVPGLFSKLGVSLVEAFSCEGIASFLDERVGLIRSNDKAWKNFLDLLFRTATNKGILGAGEHSVFIGRKRE